MKLDSLQHPWHFGWKKRGMIFSGPPFSEHHPPAVLHNKAQQIVSIALPHSCPFDMAFLNVVIVIFIPKCWNGWQGWSPKGWNHSLSIAFFTVVYFIFELVPLASVISLHLIPPLNISFQFSFHSDWTFHIGISQVCVPRLLPSHSIPKDPSHSNQHMVGFWLTNLYLHLQNSSLSSRHIYKYLRDIPNLVLYRTLHLTCSNMNSL